MGCLRQVRPQRLGRDGRGRRPLQEELIGPVPVLLAGRGWHAAALDVPRALARHALLPPAGDLAGNLGSCRRWKGTTTPAQSQLSRTRQAELVICEKAIERSFAWATRFRRLVKDYERYASTLADLHLVAFVCLMLKQAA
uniref:Transposase n=1 Tax=Pseudomonas sp. K-62 TaxID=76885 RepID=I2FG10_9PSED|nr:transposase [Pseudomonas sp. K-62]BAM13945.1 transposase [Pseudomonas sp. K-62]